MKKYKKVIKYTKILENSEIFIKILKNYMKYSKTNSHQDSHVICYICMIDDTYGKCNSSKAVKNSNLQKKLSVNKLTAVC